MKNIITQFLIIAVLIFSYLFATAHTPNRLTDFVASLEGYRSVAYEDSVGVLTIGYGRTEGVQLDDTTTEPEAREYLEDYLSDIQEAIGRRHPNRFNQCQLDALTSFTYNLGMSRLNRLVRDRTHEEVSTALLLYVKADGKKLKGLEVRRKAEQDLFNNCNYKVK